MIKSIFPRTLVLCLVIVAAAAAPIIGDLFYAALLFGGFAALERMNPSWRSPVSRTAAV